MSYGQRGYPLSLGPSVHIWHALMAAAPSAKLRMAQQSPNPGATWLQQREARKPPASPRSVHAASLKLPPSVVLAPDEHPIEKEKTHAVKTLMARKTAWAPRRCNRHAQR